MNYVIRAQNAPWYRGIELRLTDPDQLVRVKDIVFEKITEADAAVEHRAPFLLDQVHAQTLMDDLWHCGIRPTEGSGSAGALAATERHLSDLRTIALHALKISKP